MEQICPDCGSENVEQFEEVGKVYYECLDCTIWFDPEHPEVKRDQQRIREGKEPLGAL